MDGRSANRCFAPYLPAARVIAGAVVLLLGILMWAGPSARADATQQYAALTGGGHTWRLDGRALTVTTTAPATIITSGRRIALRRAGSTVQALAPRGQLLRLYVNGRLSARGLAPVLTVRSRGRLVRVLRTSAGPVNLVWHRLLLLEAERARSGLTTAPLGEDASGRFVALHRSDWRQGYWAGALWRATTALGGAGIFKPLALAATERLAGLETLDTHDLGFLFGLSSLRGYDVACRGAAPLPPTTCTRLRASAAAAAETLVRLRATSPGLPVIPVTAGRCRYCTSAGQASVIIDSLMNLRLLRRIAAIDRRPDLTAMADAHARALIGLLQRPDGSTIQALRYDRGDGTNRIVTVRQGLGPTTTWARGQAWAIHGFADAAAASGDPALRLAAERAGRWWRRHLADGELPRWDFSSAHGVTDTSAAAIAAAGMLRLARLRCPSGSQCLPASAWRRSARALVKVLDRRVTSGPPGRLAGQVYVRGGDPRDDDCEMLLGTEYLLEAHELMH
jgi:unsaturated chondroitin disaccharide hydrolase